MVKVIRAPESDPDGNPEVLGQPRKPGEGNLAWCERARLKMKGAVPEEWTHIALVGGADNLAFRLRVAQSHLRDDMLPSFWSEALLVDPGVSGISGATVARVPLLQPDGDLFARSRNGVVMAPLAEFDDAERYPNFALIAVHVPQADILARLESFKESRAMLDALEHVLRWLAFAWGVARTGNPLHDNFGLPSACMLEMLFAAEGCDLTPGLESRASCPEAIWAAVRRWHRYFATTDGPGRMPFGRFVNDHRYAILGHEGPAPEAAATRPRAKARGARRAE
jgi:hypothetical protein